MTVNGENLPISDLNSSTIDALLLYFKLSAERVAIEYNGSFLKREKYNEIILNDSDVIELVHFVGGGRC